jgi:hypothetical protein
MGMKRQKLWELTGWFCCRIAVSGQNRLVIDAELVTFDFK